MDASKLSADSRTLRLEATPAQIRGRILVTSPGRQAKLGRYCRYADHPLLPSNCVCYHSPFGGCRRGIILITVAFCNRNNRKASALHDDLDLGGISQTCVGSCHDKMRRLRKHPRRLPEVR